MPAAQALTLSHPGDQTNRVGDAVSLSIQASAPLGAEVTYRAVNLPAALQIDAATGMITGVITGAAAADSPYAVTLRVSAGAVEQRAAWNWTVLPLGRITGRIIAPPGNVVEVEPNDTLQQAQEVTLPATVAGDAAASDPGLPILSAGGHEVEDLYWVQTVAPAQITLAIAADDPQLNDLDLLLIDADGRVLDVSEGVLATEVLDIETAGSFLVGVRAFSGFSAYALSITDAQATTGAVSNRLAPGAAFVPGEILATLTGRTVSSTQAMTRLARRHGLTPRAWHTPGAALMRVAPPPRPPQSGKLRPALGLPNASEPTLRAQTLDRLHTLRADPGIAHADLNYLRQPALAPRDTLFEQQWHYEALNLPEAWEITTGSDRVIVAVIDTGVLVNHPDLQPRLLPGYDFISDAYRANDGDGPDANPNDAGDDPDGLFNSFHGSHVAGLIGAATDNGIGVAGVTWQTRLMPLRVSGIGGASDADIIQALYYAAGLPNHTGALPSEPAHIINISLAGPGFSQALHHAIQRVLAQGVIVVAAAGNQHTRTPFYPAAHDGVFSVTAVDPDGEKAWYANFGPSVDLAAPGGDLQVDRDGDGALDGVLSTSGEGGGQFTYALDEGTSMASPHTAGVLALMLAANPRLTQADIERLLAGTHPDTPRRMTRDLGVAGRDEMLGYGVIDALQATQAAQSITGGLTATALEPVLSVSASALYFPPWVSALPIYISNAGGDQLHVSGITADASWLTLAPVAGIAPFTVQAIVDRKALTMGAHHASIEIVSDARVGPQTATIEVDMEVGERDSGRIGAATVLAIEAETSAIAAQVETDAARHYAFTLPSLAPGTYIVLAGTDRDGDGVLCETADTCGVYGAIVTLTAGRMQTDIALAMAYPAWVVSAPIQLSDQP